MDIRVDSHVGSATRWSLQGNLRVVPRSHQSHVTGALSSDGGEGGTAQDGGITSTQELLSSAFDMFLL